MKAVVTAAVFGDPRMPRRFWDKIVIDPESGCWLWTAHCSTSGGYARFGFDGKAWEAYRLAYLRLVGEIGAGLQLDHLCRVRRCVNPAHLEPVSLQENNRRGNSLSARRRRQTHCKRGHALVPGNLRYRSDRAGIRECLACHSTYWERKRSR